MEQTEKLEDIQVFNDFAEREIEEIFQVAQICRYNPKEVVFDEQSTDTSLYIILRGEFEILGTTKSGEKHSFSVIGEGTVFGEMSFLDGQPRSATVQAKSEAEILKITKDDFNRLMETAPDIATKFFQDLARVVSLRLRHADAFIVEMIEAFQDHIEGDTKVLPKT